MGNKSHDWVKQLSLAKWWYNTTLHYSNKLTSFEALYGYLSLRLLPYSPGTTEILLVDQALCTKEKELDKLLRHNLQLTHDRMKNFEDLK